MAKKKGHAVKLQRGKGDFVLRRTPEGGIEKVCLCEWNADISKRGCISQVDGELIEEVILNDGHYAPGNFSIYKKQGRVNKMCWYCYDLRKNSGGVGPKAVDERTRADFEKKNPREIRLGKSTEVGHIYYYHPLMDLLGLCAGKAIAVIFPTKMFPFGMEGIKQAIETRENKSGDFLIRYASQIGLPTGAELSPKLKAAQVSLMYSIGHNKMEPGAVSQGYPNSWRILQAKQYHEQGVNTSLTIVADVTQSLETNTERGFAIGEALEAYRKYGINMRIVPLRMNSNIVSLLTTGMPIGRLKDSGYHGTLDMFDCSLGGCQRRFRTREDNGIGQNVVPEYLHDDFQRLFEEGIGICGQVGDIEHCDKCNLYPSNPERVAFPRSEVPRVEYKGTKSPKLIEIRLRKHPKLIHVPGKYKGRI